jgi:5-oxoprolinase (ATP-hydrolysing)
MLRELSLSQGLEPVATIYAEDLMDDGSTIRLAVTIDREQGCARFDF